MSIKRIINCIKANKAFVITTHKNPEGDALGSEIALYRLLKKLDKSAIIVNQDRAPQEYYWLSGTRLIKRYKHNMKLKFDVLVMLDCSNKSRCGRIIGLISSVQPVINIDHHISNDRFGDINWVLPAASSVSEMIYLLYKNMRIKIDAQVAKALYVGIMTDTGSFRYTNTTSLTHTITARLLKFNLDVYRIYRNIYESIPFADMSLLSKLLSTLEKDSSGKIIIFTVKKHLLERSRLHIDLTEHILNFGRSIRNSEVCVLFRQQQYTKGIIRVNLRSQGRVDVNQIAQYFGGGGHKTSSGCTLQGSLDNAKNRVIKKIRQQL